MVHEELKNTFHSRHKIFIIWEYYYVLYIVLNTITLANKNVTVESVGKNSGLYPPEASEKLLPAGTKMCSCSVISSELQFATKLIIQTNFKLVTQKLTKNEEENGQNRENHSSESNRSRAEQRTEEGETSGEAEVN